MVKQKAWKVAKGGNFGAVHTQRKQDEKI